jgi:hypothetical protein
MNNAQILTSIKELQNTGCYSGYHTKCKNLITNIVNNIQFITDYNVVLNDLIVSTNLSNSRYLYYCHTSYFCTTNDNYKLLYRTLFSLCDFTLIDGDNLSTFINIDYIYFTIFYNEFIKKHPDPQKYSSELINFLIKLKNEAIYSLLLNSTKYNINYDNSNFQTFCTNKLIYQSPFLPKYQAGITTKNSVIMHPVTYVKLVQLTSYEYSTITKNIIKYMLLCRINITKVDIINAILSNMDDNIIIELFSVSDPICEDYLFASCIIGKLTIIKFLFDNRLEPTSSAFNYAFDPSSTSLIRFLSSFKLHNGLSINNNFQKYITDNNKNYKEILQIFINYNYMITYENLLSLLKYKLYVPNIESYNIKFDDRFLHECSLVSFYPQYPHSIKPTIKELIIECGKNHNDTIIETFIKKYGITPNAECIEKAVQHPYCIKTVKLLYLAGAPISINALFTCMNSRVNNASSFILNNYYNDVLKSNNNLDSINAENKKLKELLYLYKSKYPSLNTEFDKKLDLEMKQKQELENKEKIENKEENKPINKPINKIINKIENKIENKKSKKSILNSVIEKKPEPKIENKIELEKFKYNNIKTNIKLTDVVPISYEIKKILNIDTDNLNLLILKQSLIKLIKDYKLFKLNSYTIEHTPELIKIYKILNYDYNTYGNDIDFKTFDKFCEVILSSLKLEYENNKLENAICI